MKSIIVRDKMQNNYRYDLIEPEGKNFAADFKPELTPKKMLELGVFGGKYLTDCQKEFPRDWFVEAKLAREFADVNLNYFQVSASQPLSEWQRKGWIYQEDPRGWFQWYCRYYFGRRIEQEDRRQINRWKAFRRHELAVIKHCPYRELGCRRKQRQALLHWAYDSRKI